MEKKNSFVRRIVFGLTCALAGFILAWLLFRRAPTDTRNVPVSDTGNKDRTAEAAKSAGLVPKTSASTSSAQATTAVPAADSPPRLFDDEVERRAFLKHPELKRAVQMNLRREVLRTYGHLERILNLDPKTANRLTELLTAKRWASYETKHSLAERGISRSSPEHRAAMAESDRRYEEEIKTLLGDGNYQRLESASSIHNYSVAIQSGYYADFRGIDEPLTPAQSEGLAVIMAVNMDRSFLKAHGDGPASDREFLLKSEAAVLLDAKDLLSEKQLSALRSAFEDRRIENDYKAKRGRFSPYKN